jgi:hypothetical protein
MGQSPGPMGSSGGPGGGRALGNPLPMGFSVNEQVPFADTPLGRADLVGDNNNFDYPERRGGLLNQDVLMGSPGGLASSVHHWTGGFYGKGGSNTDKFPGQNSNPYPSGEFGNMYSPDANVQLNDSFEVLPYTKLDDTNDPNNTVLKNQSVGIDWHGKQVSIFWAAGFAVILVMIYFVLSLWSTLGMRYLDTYLGQDGRVTIQTLLFASLAGTLFLIFFCWLLGISFLSILSGQ